jgi:hypothetical protein
MPGATACCADATGIERRRNGGERRDAGSLDFTNDRQDIAGELIGRSPICLVRLHGGLGGPRIARRFPEPRGPAPALAQGAVMSGPIRRSVPLLRDVMMSWICERSNTAPTRTENARCAAEADFCCGSGFSPPAPGFRRSKFSRAVAEPNQGLALGGEGRFDVPHLLHHRLRFSIGGQI